MLIQSAVARRIERLAEDFCFGVIGRVGLFDSFVSSWPSLSLCTAATHPCHYANILIYAQLCGPLGDGPYGRNVRCITVCIVWVRMAA
jgi:hypothetical protein